MRTTLAALILVIFSMMPASAGDLDAKFLIKRAGKVIGVHQVDVTDSEGGKTVETTIRMRVKFGFVPLFRYDHQAVEEWRDGALYSLTSTTNNNGDEDFVSLTRTEGGFEIDGSGYAGSAPIGAMPSSYWNKDLVNAVAIINTQTGELIDVSISEVGRTMGPHLQLADQYRLVGTIALDLWYDGAQWVGSNFTIDGEELTYELAPLARNHARYDAAAD